ncbi:DUF664 domain-containing protein [Serinicoccus sediminis]|uniref:mycothiol transferase n=1 Tax=Serinicoccus sediminis TaxID=2306021 RepID=UPI0010228BEB|nr:DUF664 domain-containing protein [Serinicoccus sediminis]
MDETILGRFVVAKLDEIIDVVAGMDDETANAVPPLPGGNSAYQLLTHCLGMAQQWTREHIAGEPTGRDRDGEFRASGDVETLVLQARAYRGELVGDLADIDSARPPAGRAWGRQPFWIGTAEGILLHVLEELCQNLGHLEITRDLVVSARHADAG